MFIILFLTISISCTLSQTLNGAFSTVTALLAIVDKWLRMLDEGREIRAVFFDLRKAFDSVPHKVLMQQTGLNINILAWVGNYLTSRKQMVEWIKHIRLTCSIWGTPRIHFGHSSFSNLYWWPDIPTHFRWQSLCTLRRWPPTVSSPQRKGFSTFTEWYFNHWQMGTTEPSYL